MQFHIFQDAKLEWRWQLSGDDGKKIADSGEGYRDKDACLETISAVKASDEAIVLENLGLIASAQGRVPEARAAFEAALAIARDIDSRALVASTLLHLGTSQLDAGELDASECALGEAMALARELGVEPLQLEGHAALARLQLLRGEQPTEHLDALLPQLQSATAATLPLALHAAAVQALEAHHDPRAAALREHARAELRARSERIADAALRRSYLDIREHRAIAQSA